MSDFRYHLAKYAGKASRLECPNCHRRDFVPYVDDTTGAILDKSCGRCNHESSCGYHLTPHDYFLQHPEAKPVYTPSSPARPGISRSQAPRRIWELPRDLIQRSLRPDRPCNFLSFLRQLFPEETVWNLACTYRLGVTLLAEVIFYQLDAQGRFRAGKVVQYNPDNGKRVKDTDIPVNWLHPRLKSSGVLPKQWEMTQCLFGEHLLNERPDDLVILVEAEKTAVIGAGYLPQYVWVATGGKTQLGDKLDVLKGHKVMAIPDVDAYDYWLGYFEQHPSLGVHVSDMIEREVSYEDREAQIDIADWLIRAYGGSYQPSIPGMAGTLPNLVAREVAKFFSPDVMPEVAALIEELDLQFVSAKQINPETTE